jgi:hypothetical protein
MSGSLKSIFSFPNPVNEVAARTVAAAVVLISLSYVVTGNPWVLLVLSYGFFARVATGPTLSPVGLLATRVIADRIAEPRLVPGPPKRFAQSVGLVFSVTAVIFHFGLNSADIARIVISVLTVFAFLESALGFCCGCYVFTRLINWGLIPESICKECIFEPHTSTN